MLLRSGRLERRIRLAVPVEILTPQEPSSKERTTTENVCSSGVRVLTQRARSVNERLIVRSVVGDLQTQARVIYCQRLPDGQFGVGLQLLGRSTDWLKASSSTSV